MFWWIILPFNLTFVGLVTLVIIVTIKARRKKRKPLLVFFMASFLSILLFIPSCGGVMLVVDQIRFGEFTYANTKFMFDRMVGRYLPEMATDITIIKDGGGFHAKFKIEQNQLEKWIDTFIVTNKGRYSQLQNFEAIEPFFIVQDFQTDFDEVGWKAPTDLVRYEPVLAGNGAGFSLWYSESEGTAYERAGYW